MQVIWTNEIRASEACWSRRFSTLVRDPEENDIRDSDERSSGCGILVKKEREYGISTPFPTPVSDPRIHLSGFINHAFLFFPEKSAKHEMIPVGDFQIKYDNKTKKGEQIFVRRPGIAIKWPGGRTGPPRDSPECGFHGELCIGPTREGIVIKQSLISWSFHCNPESTAWDPESKTLMDSFTCG